MSIAPHARGLAVVALAVVVLAGCAREDESLEQAKTIYRYTTGCFVDAATLETISLTTVDDEVMTFEPGDDNYVAARERCGILSPGLLDGPTDADGHG